MSRRPPYVRPPPPTREQIVQVLRMAGWSRTGLAQAVHVGESTVDQWLAQPGGSRPVSPMPPGLFELAQRKVKDMT